jgi:hypothetical protein
VRFVSATETAKASLFGTAMAFDKANVTLGSRRPLA